ncbi:TRM11 family SAM-dependent methyltransferase [Pyrobaculum neutrophilum]|uniref:RNA methylase n=1 Tax=Pyrobaculum neutrophilum (strain DSM 2338 / JCM 9278 / NBRC 100436 / V24Sta) TaxID=444157 RepID=B1YCW2_PYRNV|nr:methyltransferase [Pyrobaculum neutrophilum]ACB39625.1 putative RNA methylase [Pyrobaculum neutrophilum V24Sta]
MICRVELSRRYPCLAREEALALGELGGCTPVELRDGSATFICGSCEIFARGALIKSVNGIKVKREAPAIRRSVKTLDHITARLMVNLARVKPGHRVWEPFVGTGAIAYEVERAGGYVVGGDVDEKALKIAKLNIRGDVVLSDVLLPPVSKFDAVVGDPPYGRLTASAMDVRPLLNVFLEVARSHVEKGGYLVFASPVYIDMPLLRSCAMYLHGGLYRVIYIERA